MVIISNTNVKNISEITFSKYLQLLPKVMSEQVIKYRVRDDRFNSLFGKIILKKTLEEYFAFENDVLERINVTKFGKPYINSKIEFNLSHSGSYVICAISDEGPIGIDIEKMNTIDYSDFKSIMTENEWEKLKTIKNQKHYFFDLWTKKESLIKANGKGLNIDLKSIDVEAKPAVISSENMESWFITEFELSENYKSCFASNTQCKPIYKEFSFIERDIDNSFFVKK
jgi:4'-phosphopantetheinyl transferase